MNLSRRLHGPHSLPPGGRSWSEAHSYWVWRCCKCGRFRVYGQAVEMYGETGGWWRECLTCAIETVWWQRAGEADAEETP